ncbi:MAG TPA: hypothetical protein VN851_02965 [Thermoanaerobaculia bacterium]|nr:hypothetical protein [Thermoanaerobaculia bacterium]
MSRLRLSPRPFRPFAVPLALALALAGQIAFAPPAHAAPGGLSLPFSDWLGALARLWAPEGCILDPGGRCRDRQAVAPRDEGCGIDPGGKCATAPAQVWAPAGCVVDPHGMCRGSQAVPTRDAGCGIDPGGACTQ